MKSAETSGEDADALQSRIPRRLVALGGGTGLPAMLRGLREFVSGKEAARLTAVVAMSDDGGSSGRLRRSRGMPPPGDVRNCLVALSTEEDLIAGVFQQRYDGSPEFGGHSLGNLILAALAEQTGSFLKAVEVSSRVLRTVGRILPVTLEDVTLHAKLDDGTDLAGETAIGNCSRAVESVWLQPRTAKPTEGVVDAIREADLVVIGPGSLFTSVIPTLVLEDVARALRETRAVRILVANLVSEHGEAAGLDLDDHIGLIEGHAGGKIVDAVLLHDGEIDEATRRRYRAEGAVPLKLRGAAPERLHVVRRNLLMEGPKLRHDPTSTAAGLLRAWRELAGRTAAVDGK